MRAVQAFRSASHWEWAQTILLAANLAWTTFCLGGYRPETMVVTSAGNALVLLLHFARRIVSTTEPPLHRAGFWFLPFLAYAAINVVFVAPVRWLGWHDWLGWAQMVTVFWVVLNDIRARATRVGLLGAIAVVAAISALLACYQWFVKPDWLMLGRTQVAQFVGRASGPFGVPNTLAGLLLLVLPPSVALALRRRATAVERIFFGYLAGVFALGLFLTISRGAWLGLAVALALWPMLAPGRRWRWRVRMALLTGGGIVAIASANYFAAPLARDRFDQLMRDAGERSRPIMWRGAWNLFREEPLLGTGAGSYNVLFEKYRPEGYARDPLWAHSDYLNTLSDYGAVGFILLFGPGAWLLWRIVRWRAPEPSRGRRHDEPTMGEEPKKARGWMDGSTLWRGVALGLLAFAAHLAVDFHLKIPALAMTAAAVLALTVRHTAAQLDKPRTPSAAFRGTQVLFAGSVTGAMLWFVTPHYRAEAERFSVRQEIDRVSKDRPPRDVADAVYLRARDRLTKATRRDSGNPWAWADLAYATALSSLSHPEQALELGRSAEEAARRALAFGPGIPEFWVRLGLALDVQDRWVDAGAAFNRALELAPANPWVWYHHAFHLSLHPSTKALARASVATCLRLDPGNREAEALRRNLAAGR